VSIPLFAFIVQIQDGRGEHSSEEKDSMRKGQKFTPEKLKRWAESGRGLGIFSDYQPWHQVTRADPASLGRSHLIQWAQTKRSCHVLSDGEHDAFALITMLNDVVDVREQVPLAYFDEPPQICRYAANHSLKLAPGTLACATELQLRHPRMLSSNLPNHWTMSTDFVVTLKAADEHLELLAISVKPDVLLSEKSLRNLSIEKLYWEHQGSAWLLITPAIYDKRVVATLRRNVPWGLPKNNEDIVDPRHIDRCSQLKLHLDGLSIAEAVLFLASELNVPSTYAQRTLWQTVWSGKLPMNLSRTPHFSDPISFISQQEFWQQNPIAARRSAWLSK